MLGAEFWALLGCAGFLTFILSVLASLALCKRSRDRTASKRLGGPRAFPLIGNLHELRGTGGPFEAFTRLAKIHGDIYEMQLGVSKCVVVSSFPLVKEVLITKGAHFGGRPDFLRFHSLFGGDRNNSLALCDWSDVQKQRRSIARSFCSPRGGSSQQQLSFQVADAEIGRFLHQLQLPANSAVLIGERTIKPYILEAAGNMFTQYMCSTRFGYDHPEFNRVCQIFDEIFWDINQGYAVDFLPWLRTFYSGHLRKLNDWAGEIRDFIMREIIDPHRRNLLNDQYGRKPNDFTDALLLNLESGESGLSWEHIMFELEDFLGGHSAIGNLVMLILAYVSLYPNNQAHIQEECDRILQSKGTNIISAGDRAEMPYTEAVFWETLRISSSPIVPHVATEKTEINDYPVAKGTVVFLNNFDLNLGERYWGPDARQFNPQRFLKDNKVVKPDYFLPFSTGKRTCVGQKLVQGFAFAIVTNLLASYSIEVMNESDVRRNLIPSCVAVHPDGFNLALRARK